MGPFMAGLHGKQFLSQLSRWASACGGHQPARALATRTGSDRITSVGGVSDTLNGGVSGRYGQASHGPAPALASGSAQRGRHVRGVGRGASHSRGPAPARAYGAAQGGRHERSSSGPTPARAYVAAQGGRHGRGASRSRGPAPVRAYNAAQRGRHGRGSGSSDSRPDGPAVERYGGNESWDSWGEERRKQGSGSRDSGWRGDNQQGRDGGRGGSHGRWQPSGRGRGGGGWQAGGRGRQAAGSWASDDRRGRGGWRGEGGESWTSERSGGRGGGGRSRPTYDRRAAYTRDDEEGSGGEEDGFGAGVGPTSLSQLKVGWVGDALYGTAPVLAALRCKRRQLYALYLQEGMDNRKRKDKGALEYAVREARAQGVRVEHASKHDLNMLSGNRPHQGLVLDCEPLAFEELQQLPSADEALAAAGGRPPCWLALDEVVDPQNFGAAVRSAFFLGAAGVLTCARNSAPLSAVVSKASAGALEALPIHSCANLPRTLAMASEMGWQVVGASGDKGGASAASFCMTRPTVLVMGNEGFGLRTNTARVCDTMLRIDGNSAGETLMSEVVDSLNVSVATGILLHRLISSVPVASEAMSEMASEAPSL